VPQSFGNVELDFDMNTPLFNVAIGEPGGAKLAIQLLHRAPELTIAMIEKKTILSLTRR
jgi:hypothetical protein